MDEQGKKKLIAKYCFDMNDKLKNKLQNRWNSDQQKLTGKVVDNGLEVAP